MKKVFVLLLAVGMLLSGCGAAAAPAETTVPTEPPMTAQTLVAEMIAAAEEKKATTMTIEMVMDAQIVMESMDMTMGMSMDTSMDMIVSEEPMGMYMAMDMNITAMGEETAQKMKCYYVMEDGTVVTYIHDEVNDLWVRSEVEDTMDSMDMDMNYLQDVPAESMMLEETTSQMDGREVYVLHYTLTGDQLEAAGMGSIMGAAGMEGLDFTGFEIPYTAYVDAQTFLTVGVELDMTSAEGLMNSVVSSMLGASAETAELDMDISFTEFKTSMRGIGYDPVEVPQVPEEGLLKANRGTPYPIEEADVKLNIYAPSGFAYSDGDYYSAGFLDEAYTQELWATLYTDAEFLEFYGSGDLVGFGFPEGCVEYGEGPAIEGWNTMWGVTSDGMHIYYAWTQIGGCKLLMDSADYLPDSDMDAIVAQLVNMVEVLQTASTQDGTV